MAVRVLHFCQAGKRDGVLWHGIQNKLGKFRHRNPRATGDVRS